MTWHANPTATTPIYSGPGTGAAEAALATGVGARCHAVLAVHNGSGSSFRVRLWPGDSGSYLWGDTNVPRGAAMADVEPGKAGIVACFTDATGGLLWRNGSATTTIYLLGWHDVTAHDTVCTGAPDYDDTVITTSYTDKFDLSGIFAASDLLAELELDYVSGGSGFRMTVRPSDEASPLIGTVAAGAAGVTSALVDGQPVTLLCPTGPAGILQASNSLASVTVDGWVHGIISDWNRLDSAIAVALVPPTGGTWNDIDLSGDVGAAPAFVVLKFKRTAAAGTTMIALRPKNFLPGGSPLDFFCATTNYLGGCAFAEKAANEAVYVALPTSSVGVIQWTSDSVNPWDVTLVGYVTGAVSPVVSGQAPEGQIYDEMAPVEFNVDDTDSSIIEASIRLRIYDEEGTHEAITGGAFNTPLYDGTITVNGTGFDVELTTHPPFLYGRTRLEAYAESNDGGTVTSTWYILLLRTRTILDLDPSHSLIWVPGTSKYKRTADGLWVTPVDGLCRQEGIVDALLGSDGATSAEFPTLISPRGISCDGGDQLNGGDDDIFTFADAYSDYPFSLVAVVQADVSGFGADRGLLGKGASKTGGEYGLYIQAAGGLSMLLSDDTAGAYIERYAGTRLLDVGVPTVCIGTCDGSGLVTGLKVYQDAEQVDDTSGSSGTYAMMRNTADPLTLGTVFGADFIGLVLYAAVLPWELTQAQVSALTARIRALYAPSPRS